MLNTIYLALGAGRIIDSIHENNRLEMFSDNLLFLLLLEAKNLERENNNSNDLETCKGMIRGPLV